VDARAVGHRLDAGHLRGAAQHGPDHNEPRLVLDPEEVPQFAAGLITTVMPGDLTAASRPPR
jgi:hypothetical protein